MSRRGRAALLLGAAVICAALAATIAARYRAQAGTQYGALQDVVVATRDLSPGRPLDPAAVRSSLAIRRVPARFIPPGALRRPADALGRMPAAAIPPGSYVLDPQLVLPRARVPRRPRIGHGLQPLQIAVQGAEALVAGGSSPEGGRVDVVVSQQGGLGNRARTFVAAAGVRLVALQGPAGPGETWRATVAVTRPQALALIEAEASARQIRLLVAPGPDSGRGLTLHG